VDAGDVIHLVANTASGDIGFDARVLFWWEVQQSRESSIVTADIVSMKFFDRSKFMRSMVDRFLVSVQDGGRVISASDTEGRRWSQCLHPSMIKPLYDVYIGTCHSSPGDLVDFRNKVARYFGAGDADDGIFVAPTEVFEVIFMSRCGGLTLSEMRKLSYDRFKKYLIVIEHLGSVFAPTPMPSIGDQAASSSLPGVPLSVLSNPNLTVKEAEMQSASIAAHDGGQGQFGHRPE
jgi:hypothetical protein